MAIQWLGLLKGAPWCVFVSSVLVMSDFIMNVAAIALSVALVIARYMGATLSAIGYDSKQFTPASSSSMKHGMAMRIILLAVLGLAVVTI